MCYPSATCTSRAQLWPSLIGPGGGSGCTGNERPWLKRLRGIPACTRPLLVARARTRRRTNIVWFKVSLIVVVGAGGCGRAERRWCSTELVYVTGDDNGEGAGARCINGSCASFGVSVESLLERVAAARQLNDSNFGEADYKTYGVNHLNHHCLLSRELPYS